MACCRQQVLLPTFLLAANIVQLLVMPGLADAKTIYRCPQLNGPPLFSSTSCASAHQLEPVIINRYAPAPLTATEQQQLELLRKKANRPGNQKKSLSRSKNQGTATSNDCARHQEALHALQNRRRKGYKLSEAPRLEQQEQGLRQNIRLHC